MLTAGVATTGGGAGDLDARLAAIMAEHQPALLRLCTRRLGGDRHLAEDVVQETFVKLGRALARGQEIERVGAWLRTVASNGTVDELRRSSAMVLVEPPDAVVDEASFADGNPELEAAWEGLSPRHREVLRLRELEGLRYDEIATAMSTGVTAVETLLFRARAALRREYSRASAAATTVPAPVAVGAGRLRGWRPAELVPGAAEAFNRAQLRLGLLLDRLHGIADRVAEAAGGLAVAGTIAGGLLGGSDAVAPLPVPVPAVEAPAVPAIDVPGAPALPPAAAPTLPEPPTTTVTPPQAPASPAVVAPVVEDADAVVDDVVGAAADAVASLLGEISAATARNR